MSKITFRQKLSSLKYYLSDNQKNNAMMVDLKRLNPDEFYKSLYFWACIKTMYPDMEPSEKELNIWITLIPMIVKFEAFQQTTFEDEISYGKLLAESNVSEQRFLRLLNSNEDLLKNDIKLLGSLMKNHHRIKFLNWLDIFYLMLTDNTSEEDESRKKIAKDYFKTILESN
jgi:hypothetical protein